LNNVWGLEPTISLIENIQLFLIIFTLIIYAMGAPKKIIIAALYAMAALHIVFVISYAHSYNLELRIKPLLDILIQPGSSKGSAIIDLAQIIIILTILDSLLSLLRRRKESQVTNITPKSNQELYQ